VLAVHAHALTLVVFQVVDGIGLASCVLSKCHSGKICCWAV
jgi:hypothetical protein